MDSFWASLGEYFKQRAVSPLGGAFVSSWCIINYRFFVMLFADIPHQAKFDAISDFYSKDYNFLYLWDPIGYWSLGVLWPMFAVFIYLFIYPLCSLGAYSVSLFFQRWMYNLKRRSAGLTLLTKEEGNVLIEENKNYRIEVESIYKEISAFKENYNPLIFIKNSNLFNVIREAAESHPTMIFFEISSIYDRDSLKKFSEAGYDFTQYFEYVFETLTSFYFYKNPQAAEYCKIPINVYNILKSKDADIFFELMEKVHEVGLTSKNIVNALRNVLSTPEMSARLVEDMKQYKIITSNKIATNDNLYRGQPLFKLSQEALLGMSKIIHSA